MRYPTLFAAALLLAAPLLAGDAGPPPDFPPAPTITTLTNGEQAAVIPIAETAPQEAAREIAAQAAENVDLVASGEVSVEQATRDPSKTPFDLGNSILFWILSTLVFGPVIRPLSQILVERVDAIDNRLGGVVNAAVVLGFYTAAWALLSKHNPDLPKTLSTWLLAGAAGSGIASPFMSGYRAMSGKQTP